MSDELRTAALWCPRTAQALTACARNIIAAVRGGRARACVCVFVSECVGVCVSFKDKHSSIIANAPLGRTGLAWDLLVRRNVTDLRVRGMTVRACVRTLASY